MRLPTLELTDIRADSDSSSLGYGWYALYEYAVEFDCSHFEKAMLNLIENPNINSTVIMRADLLSDFNDRTNSPARNIDFVSEIDRRTMPFTIGLEETAPRLKPVVSMPRYRTIVRRIVPRNTKRDPIINQTCSLYGQDGDGDSLSTLAVVYTPHLDSKAACPYYLPEVQSVAILYRDKKLSVHFYPFADDENKGFGHCDENDRNLRIATRLVQTSYKHSTGVMNGYQKRVNHDQTLDKVSFQNMYIQLKQKFAKALVANWVESTNPNKHVFEDLAIAAFLVVLWEQMYESKSSFQFIDLGCGNGLLVHILLSLGYKGIGVDARARKSWATYPESVQAQLHEKIIVPEILLSDDEALKADAKVFMVPYAENTFLIGNHADELTVWMPLFNMPFMVIPCCSHALSGERVRFPPIKPESTSAYATLVDHVEAISIRAGWLVETEKLRIPSTRNSAIIGRCKSPKAAPLEIAALIQNEGGARGWVDRARSLMASMPRSH